MKEDLDKIEERFDERFVDEDTNLKEAIYPDDIKSFYRREIEKLLNKNSQHWFSAGWDRAKQEILDKLNDGQFISYYLYTQNF